MGFNIVDLVTDYASEQIKDKIADVIGADPQQAQTALSGAIPGLLSGLLGVTSSESGANALFNAVRDQDDGMLDNIGSMLSGSKQKSLINSGVSILGSLLGNGQMGNIVRALGGFSGLNKGSSSSLLGLLAPIVLGLVKRKLMGGGGLNVGSLIDMFSSQKDNIAAAIPAGFNLDPPQVTTQIEHRERPSLFKKLLPLLVILGILYFGYNYFMNKNRPVVSTPVVTSPVVDSVQTAPAVTVDNIQNEFRSTLGSVVNSLTGVTDVASARAAVPQITAATASLKNMSGLLGNLPAGTKQGMSQVLAATLPNLQSLVEKANAIPGVQGVIAPALEKMTVALGAFE